MNKEYATVKEALDYGTDLLEKNGIDEAKANVEFFLADLLDCSRTEITIKRNDALTDSQKSRFQDFLQRRLKGEPLQYITGSTNFFGYDIKVTNDVLIPRPETELLVEKCLEEIKNSHRLSGAGGKKEVNIFEAGTGSGCIVVALAKELRKMKINYDITSIDISAKAIRIAEENIKANSLDDGHIKLNCEDFLSKSNLNENTDYLISNPPYISREDLSGLPAEIKDYEPESSLTDNNDGLTFYRKIIELIKNTPYSFKTFCEIGFEQSKELETLLRNERIQEYKFYKDLNGIDRIMEIGN